MKRRWLIYCIVLFISACSENVENKKIFISDVPTEKIRGTLYLSENASLNVFYDICASDSFVYCLDFYNDSILKVFPSINSSSLIGYCMKGQGPNDLLFPFFMRNSFQSRNNKIKLVDLNSWSVKEINPFNNNSLSRINIDTVLPLPIMPAIKEYNETDSCIYGIDADMQHGLFFIYNKNTQDISSVDYYYDDKEISNKYSSKIMPYLFENHLVVNERADAVCVGLINVNALYLFDLTGHLKKELIVGDKITYPEPDPQYLDFPNAKKYFVSMTGTNDFLYCLYNADASVFSSVFKFDWEGNLLSVMQTDMKLEKISVNPTNKYIYGIKMSEEGGSDIFKFDMRK